MSPLTRHFAARFSSPLLGLALLAALTTRTAAQDAPPSAPVAQPEPAPVPVPASAPAPAAASAPAPAPAPAPAAASAPAPAAASAPAPAPAPALPAAPVVYQLPPPAWTVPPTAHAPSFVLPPLPAGYAYVPTPLTAAQPAPSPLDAARAAQLYEELRFVEERADTLEHKRVRLGGSIAMVVIGYGATLLGTAAAIGSYSAAEDIQRGERGRYRDDDDHDDLDFNDDGVVNGRDERLFRRTARISTGVAAAGLVMGILGTTRLVQKRHEKRAQQQELRGLHRRREALRSQLQFGAGAAPGQVSASVSGRY